MDLRGDPRGLAWRSAWTCVELRVGSVEIRVGSGDPRGLGGDPRARMLLLAGARRRFLLLADLRLIFSSLTSPHGRIFFACPSAWAHPLCLLIRLDVSYYILQVWGFRAVLIVSMAFHFRFFFPS